MSAKRLLLWASVTALVAVIGALRLGEVSASGSPLRPLKPTSLRATSAVRSEPLAEAPRGMASVTRARTVEEIAITHTVEPAMDEVDHDACCELLVDLLRGDAPVGGKCTIVAGLNSGRTETFDGSGAFEGLYPGLHLVRIETALGTAERAVRLEAHRPARLHLDFGQPVTVQGQVQQRDGRPVPGARVTVDGSPVSCDAAGNFSVVRACPGPAYVTARAPGFAHHGSRSEGLDLRIQLEPEARLHLEGGAQHVLITPRSATTGVHYPWHWIESEIASGAVDLRGLPAGEFVLGFRDESVGGDLRVHLTAGELRSAEVSKGQARKPLTTLRDELQRRGTTGRALRTHFAFAR